MNVLKDVHYALFVHLTNFAMCNFAINSGLAAGVAEFSFDGQNGLLTHSDYQMKKKRTKHEIAAVKVAKLISATGTVQLHRRWL